ncbi:MAG: DUF1015 domain-containing protein [Polyangiaceae bacterium]|nr:DUF1015 domain-containing protein [Polyangiaceae bacterium]
MAELAPFRALRPPRALAARVASPPYDVVSTEEARALAAGNADSYLRVSRPEIDLPAGTDEHSDVVYAQGPRNLADLVARGVLVGDPEPHFYVYAQRMGAHRQVGLVACASVAEYVDDRIKKHEKTRADKEDDRVRHITELAAHDEPVFLTYRAVGAIDALVARAMQGEPEYDFAAADGVEHRLWVVGSALGGELAAAFARQVPALYVADGHHRSAAAARVHAALGAAPGEHGVFLAVVFPHDQMQILPYTRLVRDRQGRSPAALLAALSLVWDVEPAARPEPESAHTFGLYLDGKWYRARVRPGSFPEGDPVASLDCSICQDQVLAPLFGIEDPRRDRFIDFIGGIHGARGIAARVDRGDAVLGIYLHPTSIDSLMAVSDAGRLMPPKSTWFEPKLRSGLFVHRF